MKRLLIVEDDPTLRLLYEDEFAEAGYAVTLAASGEEALDRVREGMVDAVILDIRLPGMDGIETMRRILAARPNIAVILNSAYATFKSNFSSWSADCYVVKSSDLSELKQALEGALAPTVA